MKFIKPFKNITKTDFLIAGGKGASLGEIINSKIPVSSGSVVLRSLFEYFLSENDPTQEIDEIISRINHKEILKFSKLILKIESHYGFPWDIEWGFEKGKFFYYSK